MILGLPGIKGFSSLKWQLVGNVAVAENDLGNTFQRIERDGAHWLAALNLPKSKDDDAGVFLGWLAQASKGSRWFYLSPPQSSVRGNWNPQELVANGDFKTGLTTGWTANNGDTTITVNARRLKVRIHAGGVSNGDARQNVTMEANKPHVLLVDAHRGSITAADVMVRKQSNSDIEASASLTAPSRGVLLVTPTVADQYILLRVPTTVLGDHNFWSGVSLCRCLQVAGASQTGSRLNVDGGPPNMNAALKAGQYVCFLAGTLYQLVQLTEDFDTDAGGAGTLVYEPPLRASPADNAAVIVRKPFARFMFPKPGYETDVTPPIRYGVTINVREDITP